jgi:hypothetical protein
LLGTVKERVAEHKNCHATQSNNMEPKQFQPTGGMEKQENRIAVLFS